VFKFLPRVRTVIFENADVLQPGIALQVVNALRGQREELLDLRVVRVPKLAIVARVFQQNFMSANGMHTVV